MALDVRMVQQLAPDPASFKAAVGLARPAQWGGIGVSPDASLLWGECQGSGSKPYRVVVDLHDNGTKCSCPSRKFPCKHALALLWMRADPKGAFATAEPPDWSQDWIQRRRAGAQRATANADPDAPIDPKAAARKAASVQKRSAETEALLGVALDALDAWIGDQLRTGLAQFIDQSSDRCRRIATRMVDGKAGMLAARIDEMPARILAAPVGDRIRIAIDELGKLVLISKAFRAQPKDPGLLRTLTSAESKDSLLSRPETQRVSSTWDVLTDRAVVRRDGIVAKTTWLLNLGAGPRFAMVVEFAQAKTGGKGSVLVPGERFVGTLAYYPGTYPLRAVLVEHQTAVDSDAPWPVSPTPTVAEGVADVLGAEPWMLEVPIVLPTGRVMMGQSGAHWWQSACGTMQYPLIANTMPVLLGMPMTQAVAVWTANRLDLLAVITPWGRLACQVTP